MYFTMDEIGFANTKKIKNITAEPERWKFIYEVAKTYGFEGVHFTPELYEEFGLDLSGIPAYFQDFKLTLHFSGLYRNIPEPKLTKAFEIATQHGMHDISLHPPDIYGLSSSEKSLCYDLFRKTIEKWLEIALKNGITLSLESHVEGRYFLFDGLEEYVEFIDLYPELGVLIDISHNYFDGYTEDEIISFLSGKNVKGLHISDALRGVDIKEGTHLAIGHGTMDVFKLLNHFADIPELYSVLEIKADNEGIADSLRVLQQGGNLPPRLQSS